VHHSQNDSRVLLAMADPEWKCESNVGHCPLQDGIAEPRNSSEITRLLLKGDRVNKFPLDGFLFTRSLGFVRLLFELIREYQPLDIIHWVAVSINKPPGRALRCFPSGSSRHARF